MGVQFKALNLIFFSENYGLFTVYTTTTTTTFWQQ